MKLTNIVKLGIDSKHWFLRTDKQRLALTAPIRVLSATDYGELIWRLRAQHLLNEQNPEHPDSLDCHPLLREYFGKRLQTAQPQAWQQAHRQLYDYYKAVAKDFPETLEEMFAAVAHGCAAGLHQQVVEEVYWSRILRKNKHYINKKLGEFASDLAVMAHFFSRPWDTPAATLSDFWKAGVLNWTAFGLRALGRLSEATAPMQTGLDLGITQKDWKGAAQDAGNLSELHNSLGALAAALQAAEQSVEFADKSGDEFERMSRRTTLADAQHNRAAWAVAGASFTEAEALQKQRQSDYPQLYSLWGFRYGDYLLPLGDWQQVRGRAQKALVIAEQYRDLLSIALDHLSLGRASLQQACISTVDWQAPSTSDNTPQSPAADMMLALHNSPALEVIPAREWLDKAVDGLHKAGQEDDLPRGLLARCACARFAHDWDRAHRDLAIVFDSAKRSGMRLFLCDAHLEAARLALLGQGVDELSAAVHLDKAADLIRETGYLRREIDLAYLRTVEP